MTAPGAAPPPIDLTGQVAVVTGAGRGLGRLYALELAARGAAVVVNDLGGATDGRGSDPDVARSVVEEIATSGGRAVASTVGVDTAEGGAEIVRTAVDAFGRLDVVVSNAGIFGTAPFEEITVEEWTSMRRVHLDGAFFLSQPAFRQMRAQGGGRFVFVASSAGYFGQPEAAHYAAAKAGLLGLTNTIAIEGAGHGIRANAVLPMGVTRMLTETVEGREKVPEELAFFDAARPELVVPLVVLLASEACGVSHHNYSACAGRYARAFVGLGQGWLAEPGTVPTAEDLREHWAEITSVEPFSVPATIHEEVAEVCIRLGII